MKDAIQEQLIVARKKQILDAAAGVFAEKGFHPTTIKAIAKAAGVADGTIYIYFENKTALLLGILDLMGQNAQKEADFSQFSPSDLRNFLIAYFRLPLMTLKADNFALFKVIMSEIMVNHELRTLYYQKILEPSIIDAERIFQQWAALHVISPVDISLLIRSTSAVIFGLMVQQVIGDQLLDARWDELPDFLANLWMSGIVSKESDQT